ncbi:MAG: CocE/NonD family hydrolase [Acidimicrobiales bacterium]
MQPNPDLSPRRRRSARTMAAALTAAALIAAGCSSSESDTAVAAPVEAEVLGEAVTPDDEDTAGAVVDAEASSTTTIAATFTVAPSVEQLAVLDATEGTELELVGDDDGEVAATGVADEFGSLLWRDVAPGDYLVRTAAGDDGDAVEQSDAVTVTSVDDVPDPALYTGQTLTDGFGYITTRDGTTLSANVVLPGPAEDGPYPTVVEYSGYGPSNPDAAGLQDIFGPLGYAWVGVNMRGTGCSGGSFQFFEPIQLLDGYDVIETVAAQPWVKHNQVGMVGISYPGISQLFVASTQPPSLAAITPLSVLDDSARSTLYPGGILNTGFALAWSDERERDSQPFGQGWEQGLVDAGDTVCEANQKLRLQNTDARALIEDTPYYVPEVADEISPTALADRIEVPVFLAGAWQDEQTGGRFPALLDDLTGVPQLYATMVNGAHTESVSPAIMIRYLEFLELYVDRETPELAAAALIGPILTPGLYGVSVAIPDVDRLAGLPYEEALATFEADPRIRILFEQGAADGVEPRAPLPRFEAGFDSWPIPEATAQRWFLGPDGALSPDAVDGAAAPTTWVNDPAALPPTTFTGGSNEIWRADVELDWQAIPDGTGAVWTSPALDETIVVVGPASLDVWLRSSAADTDLEVTISEVGADGSETYVQSGWLRASQRALDEAASTDVDPVHTNVEADAAPLPADEFTPMRIAVFPFAHVFRPGSSIRVTVDAPGGARPIWAFDDTIAAGETNEIAHDADRPSSLVLSVVPGVEAPADPPDCGSLRSQPCRPG